LNRKKVVAIAAASALGLGGLGAVASAAGSSTSGLTYTSITPTRLCDTRQVSSVGCTTGAVTANGSLVVSPLSAESGASAIAVNVIVLSSSAGGNLTVDPTGVPKTSTSNLNFVANQIIPNSVIATTGSDGKIVIYNNSGASVNIVVDLNGYFGGSTPSPAPTTASPSPSATTSSPAPTPTATSTAFGSTGNTAPTAPAGWHNLLFSDFTVNAATGSWGTSDPHKVVYTDSTGAQWTDYPDGWPSTNSGSKEGYQPSTVLSVHDGGLDFYLHNDSNGNPVGANPAPVLNNSTAGALYTQYGRFTERMRISGTNMKDFHAAHLLWPQNDSDWQSAESDFPEFGLGGGTVCAFAHYGGSGSQDSYCEPTSFDPTQWHTYTQEWGPGYRSYFIDGVLIGKSTNANYSGPERWQLQTEPSGSNDGDSGHLYVDWASVDVPN
jgi:hypothetical protein